MKIIFGYDGSDFADRAMEDLDNAGLPDNVDAAVICGADVFHVFDAAREFGSNQAVLAEAAARWRAGVDAAIAEAKQTAERGATRLKRLFPKWRISADGVADSPSWALIRAAEGLGEPAHSADLIMVGAAGHSAFGRLMFGSVANQVLAHAGCSVRIGRRAPREPDEELKLLVGVDGSPESRLAVEQIASRCWLEDTECRVVAVIDSRLRTAVSPMNAFVGASPDALALGIVGEARKLLEGAGLRVSTAVRTGRAASNLLREASEYRADSIFLGARGLGRSPRMILGSVSRHVPLHAACSVEIVRSKSLT